MQNIIEKNKYPLGAGLSLRKDAKFVELWRNGGLVFRRDVDTREKSPEFRLLIVELHQEYNAQKTKLSSTFSVSRQSINDWITSYNKHGIVGLVNSTKNIGNSNRTKGNKARINAADIQHKQHEINKLQPKLEEIKLPEIPDIKQDDMPYEATVKEHNNRYAGVFAMIILLTSYFSWFNWIIGLFGDTYKIFQIFAFMVAKNIHSIEQLKNVRSKEAGAVLGLLENLLRLFFVWQLSVAKVNSRFWFTDGHVLPYTGKEKMHKIFNTKKREVEPGSISFVTSDFSGKIVDFEIKEGGAGLREHILNLHEKWREQFDKQDFPVHIFDREGDGCEFFYNLIKQNCPFITWEKNANRKKLYETDKSKFDKTLKFNEIEYHYFEDSKNFIYKDTDNQEHKFSLRRFWIINTSSEKRTTVLAFSAHAELSQEDCIFGILNRWGASENTFKHLGERHPLAYRPGFKLRISDNQTIINPELKVIDKQIKQQ
ncbi:MAG: helix-turn-helix domain-containing protein, partial [Bacteroidales bacterium]|nr:helix-turn-helix domain-containing protein [Bacteroidales bacterium]